MITRHRRKYHSSTLLNGLVLWLPLNEASGDAIDISGNGRNFTQSGTVSAGAGKISGARGPFSVSNYFSRTDASIDPISSWSFNCWFFLTTRTATVNLFGKDNPTVAGNRQLILQAYNAGSGQANAGLFKATDVTTLVQMAPASTGSWYNFNAYHDAPAKTLGIRMNGGGWTTATYTGSLQAATANPVTVGNRPGAGADAPVTGLLDEVGWWNRVLTAAEFAALYNSGSGIGKP